MNRLTHRARPIFQDVRTDRPPAPILDTELRICFEKFA